MKKLLFAAILALVALPVQAQQLPYDIPAPSSQWLFGWYSPYQGGSTPPSQTDFNRFFKIKGTTRGIWTRKINEWIDNDNIKATFNYSTIYCTRAQYQLDYTVNYNSNGAVIKANRNKSPIYNVVPGSNAETLVNAVCR